MGLIAYLFKRLRKNTIRQRLNVADFYLEMDHLEHTDDIQEETQVKRPAQVPRELLALIDKRSNIMQNRLRSAEQE